jgi:hypothetical protein
MTNAVYAVSLLLLFCLSGLTCKNHELARSHAVARSLAGSFCTSRPWTISKSPRKLSSAAQQLIGGVGRPLADVPPASPRS